MPGGRVLQPFERRLPGEPLQATSCYPAHFEYLLPAWESPTVRRYPPTGAEVEEKHEDVYSWVPAEARSHCSLRHVVRSGDPAEQVLALAAEEHVDLLVVSGQKRRLLDLDVFGSTTGRLIRHAPAPVWVVPHV